MHTLEPGIHYFRGRPHKSGRYWQINLTDYAYILDEYHYKPGVNYLGYNSPGDWSIVYEDQMVCISTEGSFEVSAYKLRMAV